MLRRVVLEHAVQADHNVARRAGLLLRTDAWNGESALHLHEHTRDLSQSKRMTNVTRTHTRVERALGERRVSEAVDVPRWPL